MGQSGQCTPQTKTVIEENRFCNCHSIDVASIIITVPKIHIIYAIIPIFFENFETSMIGRKHLTTLVNSVSCSRRIFHNPFIESFDQLWRHFCFPLPSLKTKLQPLA